MYTLTCIHIYMCICICMHICVLYVYYIPTKEYILHVYSTYICVSNSGPFQATETEEPTPEPKGNGQQRPPARSSALSAVVQAADKQKDEVNRANVKKRLGRLLAPRVDGTFLVPQELVDQYKDLSRRDELVDEFIQSGLDKDCVGECCAHIHIRQVKIVYHYAYYHTYKFTYIYMYIQTYTYTSMHVWTHIYKH